MAEKQKIYTNFERTDEQRFEDLLYSEHALWAEDLYIKGYRIPSISNARMSIGRKNAKENFDI